eukprot:1139782-Pelagomonas_calceolata.AAC.4
MSSRAGAAINAYKKAAVQKSAVRQGWVWHALIGTDPGRHLRPSLLRPHELLDARSFFVEEG